MDQAALLADLDRRQNDVLTQLDELNAQIESVLQEWLKSRDPQDAPPAPETPRH